MRQGRGVLSVGGKKYAGEWQKDMPLATGKN